MGRSVGMTVSRSRGGRTSTVVRRSVVQRRMGGRRCRRGSCTRRKLLGAMTQVLEVCRGQVVVDNCLAQLPDCQQLCVSALVKTYMRPIIPLAMSFFF